MVLAFIAAVAVAIVGAIFKSEFEAWMPWIAERLRRLALRSVQGELRDRLDEEWSAYLSEVPGYFGKVFCAFGFNIAALSIRVERSEREFSLKYSLIASKIFMNIFMWGVGRLNVELDRLGVRPRRDSAFGYGLEASVLCIKISLFFMRVASSRAENEKTKSALAAIISHTASEIDIGHMKIKNKLSK